MTLLADDWSNWISFAHGINLVVQLILVEFQHALDASTDASMSTGLQVVILVCCLLETSHHWLSNMVRAELADRVFDAVHGCASIKVDISFLDVQLGFWLSWNITLVHDLLWKHCFILLLLFYLWSDLHWFGNLLDDLFSLTVNWFRSWPCWL